MGVYVYCVVPPACEPPSRCIGLAGVPVTTHRHDALGSWVSLLESRPEPTIQHIQAHNAVVLQAVSDRITPVPVRFGQWLDSAQRLDQHLGEKRDHYALLLELFAGTLEFGLRVLEPNRPVAPPGPAERPQSGRAHLTALRDQLRMHDLESPQIAAVRGRIHDTFAGIARAERFEPLRTPHGILSAAHLVPRASFNGYRERVAGLRDEYPELRFLLSGPWPPYSFAA